MNSNNKNNMYSNNKNNMDSNKKNNMYSNKKNNMYSNNKNNMDCNNKNNMDKNNKNNSVNNNEKEKLVFHKDMKLTDVLELNSNVRNVLMGFGMFCFGCPISQMETLEEACYTHGIDLDFFLEKLNEINDLDYDPATNNFDYDDFEF